MPIRIQNDLPARAILEDENIYIEPLDKDVMNDIKL